jgi:hypothetical protein
MSGVSAAQTPDISNPMRGAFLVGALGVVYGDIGTSPIYTLRECLKSAGGSNISEIVFGLLSLVFWSLMVVVTLKYVVFVMRADNDGEGGRRAFELLAEAVVDCIINGATEHNGGRTKSAGPTINEAKPISLASSIPARLEDADNARCAHRLKCGSSPSRRIPRGVASVDHSRQLSLSGGQPVG